MKSRCPQFSFPSLTSLWASAVISLAAAAGTAGTARADDSPYCRKVRARAASDAAMLIAPSLRLEAVKLPTAFQHGTNTVDPTAVGPEYQLRGALLLSPLDMYKGFRVLGVADADCEHHVNAAIAEAILAQDKDYGRGPALRKQITFLESRRSTWEEIAAKSEQRFASNVTTLQQVEEIRTRTTALERKCAQLAGELGRLESRGAMSFHGTLTVLARAIETTAMDYEKKSSHLRSLSSWGVDLTGGYIPPFFSAERSDVYGMVQLTHNLGAIWQYRAETRYLAARADELRSSRHEQTSRIDAFREALRSSSTQAQRELQVIDARVSALTAGRAALDDTDALKAAHALALMDLELIADGSERAYLTELIAQLRALEGT